MTFSIEQSGDSYAVDVIATYAVTLVTEGGRGIDADPVDLPSDFRTRIADHLAEQWAAGHLTYLQLAERDLARWVVAALLPDHGRDEAGLDEAQRQLVQYGLRGLA